MPARGVCDFLIGRNVRLEGRVFKPGWTSGRIEGGENLDTWKREVGKDATEAGETEARFRGGTGDG